MKIRAKYLKTVIDKLVVKDGKEKEDMFDPSEIIIKKEDQGFSILAPNKNKDGKRQLTIRYKVPGENPGKGDDIQIGISPKKVSTGFDLIDNNEILELESGDASFYIKSESGLDGTISQMADAHSRFIPEKNRFFYENGNVKMTGLTAEFGTIKASPQLIKISLSGNEIKTFGKLMTALDKDYITIAVDEGKFFISCGHREARGDKYKIPIEAKIDGNLNYTATLGPSIRVIEKLFDVGHSFSIHVTPKLAAVVFAQEIINEKTGEELTVVFTMPQRSNKTSSNKEVEEDTSPNEKSETKPKDKKKNKKEEPEEPEEVDDEESEESEDDDEEEDDEPPVEEIKRKKKSRK